MENLSSRSIYVIGDMPRDEGSNSLADREALTLRRVKHLADTISNSSELKRATHTIGSTKLSATQVIKFRWSFTVEIAESGSPLHEPTTS